MMDAKEERRRRALRTAIRVAGLVSIIATGIAYGADDAARADDTARNMKVQPYAKGCCEFPAWGPPAPAKMRDDGLARLRSAMSSLKEAA